MVRPFSAISHRFLERRRRDDIQMLNSQAFAFSRRVASEVCWNLPSMRGGGTPKGAAITSRGVSPGLPGDRGTRQRLPAFRRGVLKPWSVLPGTRQTSATAIAREKELKK